MAIGDISLTASARANLSALQNTATLLQQTQEHLSTGKSVNSASDNATAFFASQGFLNRAKQLLGRLRIVLSVPVSGRPEEPRRVLALRRDAVEHAKPEAAVTVAFFISAHADIDGAGELQDA